MTDAYIIAEAALEHLGLSELAENLICAAANAWADCVKFQLYSEKTAKKIDNGHGPLTEYRFDVGEIHDLCSIAKKETRLDFLVSVFDMESLQSCKEIGMKAVKIPSVCNESKEMLQYAEKNFPTYYVSSGIYAEERPKGHFWWLLCTSIYPCPYECVNLRCLPNYDGISDHTVGWEVPVASVAMGAKIVEKHLTLSRRNNGPDAKCSLEPDEFADMVQRIRNVEAALGDGVKKIEKAERGLIWRKTL